VILFMLLLRFLEFHASMKEHCEFGHAGVGGREPALGGLLDFLHSVGKWRGIGIDIQGLDLRGLEVRV
jgi:hypothetical protein